MRTDHAIPQRLQARHRPIANFGNQGPGAFPNAAFRLRWLALLLALLAHGAPGQAADVIKGGELYRQHCASCHGAKGRPQMVGTPDFSQPGALLKPDMTLLRAIQSGKAAMPAYQGLLRERDLLDIVAHLRTLR
jgi:cytochrome c6